MPKFCPQCGVPATGGKFCAECGQRFPDGSPDAATNATASGSGAGPAWAPKAASFQQTYGQPPAIPVATLVSAANSATSFANQYYNGANNTNNSDPNVAKQQPFVPPPPPPPVTKPPTGYASGHPSGYPSAPAVAVSVPNDPVPPAATGSDAQQCYDQCLDTLRKAKGGHNEAGVKAFKQNCRLFGLRQMEVEAFYATLVSDLGAEATVAFVPNLARLVPDDARRKELIEYNAKQRAMLPTPRAFPARDSGSSSGSLSDRGSFVSPNGQQKHGILKGRYADHPNCDICNVAFDVTKRRHQCRRCGAAICSSCSPLRMLVPEGMQCTGAINYDVSIPQRVCIQCAPSLHQYQDQLVAEHAQANQDNFHDARGRLHVPFSSSLQKECQNAADIIGNFFRDEWGSSKDRSIPSSFLEKAHGLAIMTVVKAGFMFTGQIGTGLVVAKLPDGSWSAPAAIGTVGLSGGFQIGGELIEIMIILGSAGAVKVFHKPQVNLGAGLDVAVGPYGRSAAAAAAASTSGLNANYSYSQSKGFYAGVSLQGTIITARNDLNRKFYARDLTPQEILTGHVAPPNAASPLYTAIERAMHGVEEHRQQVQQRLSLIGPCRICNCPTFVEHTTQVWNKNCKTCKHIH